MSQPIESVNMPEVAPVATKPKRERKPTLPAKLSKFLAFGYWSNKTLLDQGLITEEQFNNILTNIQAHASVDAQTEFYSRFLDESGEAMKTLRKMVAKAAKPPKVSKPRGKKAGTVGTDGTDATVGVGADGTDADPVNEIVQDSKPKRGRKKKDVVVTMNSQEGIIAQIVAAATGTERISDMIQSENQAENQANALLVPGDSVSGVAIDNGAADTGAKAVKKPRKPAVKKAVAEQPVANTVVTETPLANTVVAEAVVSEPVVAEKKPRAKKATKAAEPAVAAAAETEPKAVVDTAAKKPRAKKDKPVPAPTIAEPVRAKTPVLAAEAEDEDEEIQARKITCDGVEYLVDINSPFNIYDPETIEVIGTYDPESKTVELH